MAGCCRVVTRVLLLLLPTLMIAGDVMNHSRSLNEEGNLGEDAPTQEFKAEGGAARLLSMYTSNLRRKTQPNTGVLDDVSKTVKKRLLMQAEDVTRLYASVAAGGNVEGTSRAKKAVWGGQLSPGALLRYLGNIASHLDLSFFNANTSVDVVHGVDGLAFLGVRSAHKVYMTRWRGRLILAVIEASSVSLHAVEPGTHKVHRTEGPRGRHDCEFAQVAEGRLLLVCITAGEPEQFEEVFGNQTNTKGKVTVYEIKESPTAPGHGPLSCDFVSDIGVHGPRDVEIWTQKNTTFCVIVSGETMVNETGDVGGSQQRFNLHTSSPVYRWQTGYLDKVELLPGTNPVAAHHFKVNEFHYLAFANYQDNKGRHSCDSMIYRFCVDQERYLPFQAVKTRGARHMHSFTLGSRPLHHTFLAIANFCEDTQTGTCNHYTVSGIYLYHLGRFVLFQEIKTAYAVQWMAVQVNATVLLALASTERGVTLFQYNGWRFVPATHQPRHQPFSAGVTSIIATNWDGRVVLGVTNRDNEKAAPYPSLYSVSFTTSDRLREVYQKVKGWCEDLRRRVNRTEVAELMRRVHPSSPINTGNHTFNSHITIRGNLTVLAPSMATTVFVRSSGQWTPSSSSSSGGGGRMEFRVAALSAAAKQAHQRLRTVVLAAGPATWPAGLHFTNLRVEGGNASHAKHVQAKWINGRRAPDPKKVVHFHGMNRLSSLTFTHIDLQATTAVNSLNGLPVPAYVTLNGRHELGGHITLQGPVMAQSLDVTNTLDGLLVGPRSSLMTTHSQMLTGTLKCRSLMSDTLDVASVNGVPLAELLPRLVTRNVNVTITGPLRVMGDMVHRGSLRVKDIPNLDLVNPLLTSERRQQVISGDHKIGGLETQAFAVEGRVNAVRVPADVFLNSSQYSYAVPSATFSHVRAASLSVARVLNTITVTEGSLNVLLLTGDQQVAAPKTFLSLHMLQGDPIVYGGVGARRRRWASGTCGSPKARKPTPRDRSEALLVALRGVAAAQDLHNFLAKTQPGQFGVPWRKEIFFTLLKMDVNCAFILLEDTNKLMFFDILTEDWRNEDNETVLVLSHNDLTNMLTEVENYATEMVSWLHSIQFRWTDTLVLVSNAIRKMTDVRRSLDIVKVLTELIANDNTMKPESSERCRRVRALLQGEKAVKGNCTEAAALTLRVVHRIARYPFLGSGLTQLSEEQRKILLDAAVQHDLGRLVEFLAVEEGLLDALCCGLIPRWQDDDVVLLIMLEEYEKKLRYIATYLDENYILSIGESVQRIDGGLGLSSDQTGLAGTERTHFDDTNSTVPLRPSTSRTAGTTATSGEELSVREASREPAFGAEKSTLVNDKSVYEKSAFAIASTFAATYPPTAARSLLDGEAEMSSTETLEPPTVTTEPPTVTTEPPTATTEPPTATSEPPTATSEPPTTTSEPPTATSEPPAATTETAITSEPPKTTSQTPTATSQIPTATSETPTATSETPTAISETPTATSEIPTASTDTPTAISETPTATSETPTATSETPTATSDTPTATSDTPTATSDTPTATSETPTATSETPTATNETPTATSETEETTKANELLITTVTGEPHFYAPQDSPEEEEASITTIDESFLIVTEELSITAGESSLIATKEAPSVSYGKLLVTNLVETENPSPIAHNHYSPETEGSSYTGIEKSTLATAEDSLPDINEESLHNDNSESRVGKNREASDYKESSSNASEEISSEKLFIVANEMSFAEPTVLTKESFFDVIDSSIPTEKSPTKKLSPTTETPIVEILVAPHESIMKDSLAIAAKKYSRVAVNESTLGESSAVAFDESNIGKHSGEPSFKTNSLSVANEQSSAIATEQYSSIEEINIRGHFHATTHLSKKVDGKTRFRSTIKSMKEIELVEQVRGGDGNSRATPTSMAVASDAQSQAEMLLQGDAQYEEDGNEFQNTPQLVPSFLGFIENLFSFGWVRSKQGAEEPRHASCLNEKDCAEHKERLHEDTRLRRDREETTALEASFSRFHARDARSSLTATPVLSQTQVDGPAQPNNSPFLWEDTTVAILQTRSKRESMTMTPPETESLPNDWYRLKRHLTSVMEDKKLPAPNIVPSVIQQTCVSSGITTVTLMQHLTTNIYCTNCVFQYQIFQTQPVLPSTESPSSPQVTASTVIKKTLTIMMPSSSTSIDCINCAFQYQILTSQSVGRGTECASYVCVTGSTVTGLMSTKVGTSSTSSFQSWSSATVISPSPPPYDARTFGVESSELPGTVPSGDPEFQSSVSRVEPSHESSSSTIYTSRQSDPVCGHLPPYYYEDAVQRDSLVAWLEVVLLYLKEIQSIEPMVFLEHEGGKLESEEASLRIVHKLIDDTSHFVRWLANNLFHGLKVTNLNLMILESERFRMKMKLHLGKLESFPEELKAKMDELRNLTALSVESVISALQCLGEEQEYTTRELVHDYETSAEKTTDDGVTTQSSVPPAGRKGTTHGSEIFGEGTITSPRLSSQSYEGTTLSDPWHESTHPTIFSPLTTSSTWSKYNGSTSNNTTTTTAITVPAIPTAAATVTPTTMTTANRTIATTVTVAAESIASISIMTTPTETINTETTFIPTTTPSTHSFNLTHNPNITATLNPPLTTTTTPTTTVVSWPSVTHASVTPNPPLGPRVRIDGYSAAVQKRVTQDDGDEAMTHEEQPGSSQMEVTTTPSSTHTMAFPGIRHPATDTRGLWVLGRVAGHRLQDLIDRSSAHLPAGGGASIFILNNMGRINNVTFNDGLWVRQVQNVDMGRLLRHGLLRHAKTVHTSITFSRPVHVVGPVRAPAFNGQPAAAFVTLAGHHVLPQHFVFMGSVMAMAHVRVRGEVSGVDLALLSRSVAVTSSAVHQMMLQPVTFARVSAANVVFAHGRVRDVPLGDLVRLDRPTEITGMVTFKDLMVQEGEVYITSLNAHFINGVNVTDLFFNSLTTNPGRAQVILGPIVLKTLNILRNVTTSQGLTVSNTSATQTTLRIHRVARRVVYRDQDAKVTGNLLLRGSADVMDLTFRDSFDSVTAATYDSGWLLKMSSQTFGSPLVLAKVKAQSTTVAPGSKLKGVDMTRLFKATMKVNEEKVVTTPAKMSGAVSAKGVWVSGTVQGLDLSTAAIIQNSSGVVFTAPKMFVDAFHVSGSLTSPDLGGADSSRLCRGSYMKRLVIVGEAKLQRLLTSDAVHLGHHVLKRDSMDGYWRLNHSAVLASHMTFQELKVTHAKADSVNGEDIIMLSRNILRRSCRRGERQVFSGNLTAPFLVVQRLFTNHIVTTLINDRPVSDLKNIFTRGGRQSIQRRWALQRVHTVGSMMTSGGVNGLHITDICVFDKPCTITAKKTLARDLIVKGDLRVQPGRTVQGVDVSEELRDVVTSTACGPVPGLTTITGTLTVSHLSVHGLVDGVHVTSKDLLTRSGAQVMMGKLTIKITEGAVAATAPSIQALDGLFNSWNLSERWQNAFPRDQDIVVRKPVVFQDFVKFRNVAKGPWSPERIKSLPHQRFHHLEGLSHDATRAISGAVRELWGWRSVKAIQGPAARVVPLGMIGGHPGTQPSCPSYLVVVSRTGQARLLNYDGGRRKYMNAGVALGGGCVKAVAGYRSGGEDHVVTAHTCTDDSTDSISNFYGSVAEGLEAVQVWRVTTRGPQLLHRIAIGATDVKVVEMGERVCLVVGTAKSNVTLVYCSDSARKTFSKPRLLATGCSVKVSAAQHRDYHGRLMSLVAVAGRDHYDPHNDSLSLWLHDAEQNDFLLVQREALRGVRWVDITSHGTDLFMAAVTQAFHGDTTGRMIVYRVEVNGEGYHLSPYFGAPRPDVLPAPEKMYSPRRHLPKLLVRLQTLKMTLPLEAHFAAVPSGPLYLLVVGQHGNITRFTQKGIQRFAEEGLYHAPGRQKVDVWVCVEDDGGLSINMALAGTWCREETCSERRREDAEILEANFRPGPPVVGPTVIY